MKKTVKKTASKTRFRVNPRSSPIDVSQRDFPRLSLLQNVLQIEFSSFVAGPDQRSAGAVKESHFVSLRFPVSELLRGNVFLHFEVPLSRLNRGRNRENDFSSMYDDSGDGDEPPMKSAEVYNVTPKDDGPRSLPPHNYSFCFKMI